MTVRRRNMLSMAVVAIASAMLFYLAREHWGHVFGLLLFLACPLMHLFMHHDHGSDHEAGQERHHVH